MDSKRLMEFSRSVIATALAFVMINSLDVLAALAILYFSSRFLSHRKYTCLPLPPGPKGLPLIGNLWELPRSFEWKTYHKWCKEFGTDILYLNIVGQDIVVLDSAEAVLDLMEKRSSIYSSRARMPMINELIGFDFNFGFMKYGTTWRKCRRLMHHSFHPKAAILFQPHSLKAARNWLNRMLDNPDDLMGNLRHMAGETIMSAAYGIAVQPKDDLYIKTAEKGVHSLVVAGVPGTFLVDTIPLLKYVPAWMPGAEFQRKAREWRKLARNMVELPYQAAKKGISEGTSPPSFTSICLEKMDSGTSDDAYREEYIQSTAGTMYSAASDTTVSAISSCILGLLERPDVFKRAQKDLDRIVKPGHLPDFDNEPSLPFITAILKETLRWRDVVPIAIPRYLEQEDEYKGYRIPAGAIVIPNSWALLHDERIYPEPFEFKPERFMKDGKLNSEVRDPGHACWGFGRRACPGRYMAFSAMWIAIASFIYVFDIKKAVDEDGNEIELPHDYDSALVVMPKPFPFSIKARSEQFEKLIRANFNADVF